MIMTRIKRYLLFILAIITVAFPSPAVRASDEALEIPETKSEQVVDAADKTEDVKPAAIEKIAEPLVQSTAQSNIVVQPQPESLPASPIMITSYQTADGSLQFFQLYNNSSDMQALDGWKLEYRAVLGNNEALNSIDLHAWLLPHQYAVFSQAGFLSGADSEFTIPATLGYTIDRIQLIPPDTFAVNQVSGNIFTTGTRYELTKSSAGNYTTTSKFIASTEEAPLYGKGLYVYPDENPLKVIEILANAENCSPLDKRIECHDYVKLYNTSSNLVDTSSYRVRLGYGNQTAGIANTVRLSGDIEPGGYRVVASREDGEPLDITASGGNVWIEDTYGLKTYDSTIQAYGDIGDAAHKGHSWAFDDGDQVWKWGAPSPNGPNNFVLPQKIVNESSSGLTPCRSDQERNPETNRCRNIASSASTLVPCAPNQIRSVETNRCRSLASEVSTLVPCTANQERNPETNRCRNKSASGVPDAAFAVEPVKESGKAFVGWWALGGVGVLAIGYGVWEWRREMISGIKKVTTYFTSRK